VLQEAHQLLRVLEAPLAHVQAVYILPDELLWVALGREPRFDDERAENDVVDVEGGRVREGFLGGVGGAGCVAFCAEGGRSVCEGGADGH
jgi:hypothetical protein